jgi:hypothetical protein
MAKIFIGQTKLDLVTLVGQDITGAITVLLKYQKPTGATGSFTPTITNAVTGELTYNVGPTDLDVAGNWIFWSYIVFADLKIGIGSRFKVVVSVEGA